MGRSFCFRIVWLVVLVSWIGTQAACSPRAQGDRPRAEPVYVPSTPPGVARSTDRKVGFLLDGGPKDPGGTLSIAKQAGMEFYVLGFNWNELESRPGRYKSKGLKYADRYFPKHGLQLFVALHPIDIMGRRFPKDLRGKAFDDPEVIARYNAAVSFILSQLPNTKILGFALGVEVEDVFQHDPSQWREFLGFVRATREHIHRIRPGVPVGVKADLYNYLDDYKSELRELNRHTDDLYVNYFGMGVAFQGHGGVEDPKLVSRHLDRLATLYPGRKIQILEFGYPSSRYLGSSEQQQAIFIREAFRSWDRHDRQIQNIFFTLNDLRRDQVKQWARFYETSDRSMVEYLSSTGLRAVDGREKEGFRVFKEELRRRSWPVQVRRDSGGARP